MEAFPTNNLGGNEYFNSGTTQNYTTNRGLMKFDVAGALPANARITYVTLTVEVVRGPVDGDAPSNFGLHRVLRDWGEGNKSGHPPQQAGLGQPATTNEATWFHRFAFTTNTWASPGGAPDIDYVSAASSETFVYREDFSPYVFDSTAQLISEVQSWLDHPESNFGWMLRTDAERNNFTARRFASREDPSRAPLLAVDYTVAPMIEQVSVGAGMIAFRFRAVAGRAYAVEYCEALNVDTWSVLTNIPPLTEAATVTISDSVGHARRFYRVAMP
jgi:hypothetical protein